MWNSLRNLSLHRQVLALAIPMVLSNITIPLLGLIDAAVIGHLEHAWYLGGVAVGGTMISVTFWLLGFLRMATTGLTAQAYGAENKNALSQTFSQGIFLALCFSFILLLFHQPLSQIIFSFSDASVEVKHYAEQYFSIRIWSAPAALSNLVIMGWLLGTQNARYPMWLVIITNSINIILDLLFVVGFHWKVEGAALASVIADYSSLVIGLWFVLKQSNKLVLPSFIMSLSDLLSGFKRLLNLNRDIFLRSLCLQACFTFMTFQGASLGVDIVAANAVLMSFLMMISYGMDGFAYAMEAMVGKAIGAKSRTQLADSLIGTTFWSLVISSLLSLVFGVFGYQLIAMISSIEDVQKTALIYLPWLIAMPLVSMWCFLLDGIFVGATKGSEMRNSMFIAMITFFSVWWLMQDNGNHALWAAMISFMVMRGLSLAVTFYYQWKKAIFLS
ncbi:MATE family efflux transporter DinF [Aliivibrio fischeri]|uniref:MATE family efflux transporter DinF n=1 Tax=Aliivibrio fischeri TaxID=668 RepID=UPI0007C56578|nr:MATE family efflux transporter DinF [Aliivibrio fischeri]